MVANQRKILVTGATGQLGGSLARLLLQIKHKVYALTRNTQLSAAQDIRNKGANIVKEDLDLILLFSMIEHLAMFMSSNCTRSDNYE